MDRVHRIGLLFVIGILAFILWLYYYNLILHNYYKFQYIFSNYVNIDTTLLLGSVLVSNCLIPALTNVLFNEVASLNYVKMNYLPVIILSIFIVFHGIYSHTRDPFLAPFLLGIIYGTINIVVYFAGIFAYL